MTLKIPIGVSGGQVIRKALTGFPHLLVAGSTGGGKSNWLRAAITDMVEHVPPWQLRLDLMDLKEVELVRFADLPHTDSFSITRHDVSRRLSGIIDDMHLRGESLKAAGVVDIREFNHYRKKKMPYRVVIVDEFANLFGTKEIQDKVQYLAMLARYSGIHLILVTQRPSAKILDGDIKTNITARLSFPLLSQVDSRVVLDTGGAEQLTRKGQALFRFENKLIKVQALWLSPKECDRRLTRVRKAASAINAL